jgi:hypothetical protein
MRFGYPDDVWEAMVRAGYEVLCEQAKLGGRPISYGALSREVQVRTGSALFPFSAPFPHLLGDISRRSLRRYGVLLTSLLVVEDGSGPGPGFYDLAREHGLWDTTVHRWTYWRAETRRTIAAYS